MMGDFDWGGRETVGRHPATCGVWCSLIVVNVIRLSITLAILLDAFAHVKEHSGNAVTLVHQCGEMVRNKRLVRKGQ
jgi:hypothetical protein